MHDEVVGYKISDLDSELEAERSRQDEEKLSRYIDFHEFRLVCTLKLIVHDLLLLLMIYLENCKTF